MTSYGIKYLLLWILLFLIISCSLTRSGSQNVQLPSFIGADSIIAIRNVSVIPVEVRSIEENRTVILADGKIQNIYAPGEALIPESAVTIDGSGKYLLPGLLDMHVHISDEDLPNYLSHGITTVRNMWGTPDIKALASRIKNDSVTGPEIYSSSPGIDGTPPTWGFTQVIEDPAEAPALVEKLKDEGWPFLKVYNRLDPDVYMAVAQAANAENIRFLGHSPFAIPIQGVLDAGQATIEHFTGYDRHLGGSQGFNAWVTIDESKIPVLAEMTSETETWNCPTLVVLDALTAKNLGDAMREITEQNRFKLLKALYDRRAKLLIGTDAGVDLVSPGASLHQEIEKFVQAGIPTFEVIKMATLGGAQFLGIDDQVGTVSVGKQADLVLTDENPLENIGNISTIEGVFVDGAWYTTSYFD